MPSQESDAAETGPPQEMGLGHVNALLDEWLRAALERRISPGASRFGEMIEYHLGWRDEALQPLATPAPAGKRLRPALTLLTCEAVCGSAEPARGAALAVELVHNFSIVHDDIQDASPLRRHRPTAWSLWGMEQGINLGDALFTLAQIVLLEDPSRHATQMALALNAACLQLVEGQYLDLDLQAGKTQLTADAYESMIQRKTGALFECACLLGAMAGGASEEEVATYARYGLELGLAFQEQDDLLGVWGKEAETGKPRAADVVARKRGLPAALALGAPGSPAWLEDLYDSTEDLGPEDVERVIAHFASQRIREHVEAHIHQRLEKSLACLHQVSGSEPARTELAALCAGLAQRRA